MSYFLKIMCNKNKVYLVLIPVLLSLCLAGCATSRTQRLAINSNIPGAVVKIDGQAVGQTPFQGDMPRSSKNRTITVETRGYDAQSQSMTANITGLSLANSIFGGVFAVGGGLLCLSVMTHDDDQWIVGGPMIGAGVLSLTSTVVDRVNGSAYQYTPTSFYFHFADEYGSNTDEILLRKYAMLNHTQIAIDAHEENGEYINALADMMSSKMSRDEAVESIKVALDYSEGDQLAFGDAIVDTFRYHH